MTVKAIVLHVQLVCPIPIGTPDGLMFHYTISYHVMLCYIMLYWIRLDVVLCHVIVCHIVLQHNIS